MKVHQDLLFCHYVPECRKVGNGGDSVRPRGLRTNRPARYHEALWRYVQRLHWSSRQHFPAIANGLRGGYTLPMPLAEKLDPVALSLTNAPVDDEPETEEELRAIAETREALRAGKPLATLEEVAKELGIVLGADS